MIKEYKNILFDLDGTLTDSAPGLMKSIRVATKHFGQEMTDEQLRLYIGPPLTWSFSYYNGLNEEEIEKALELFHAEYDNKDIFCNSVYEGVEELLKGLRAAGYKIYVATSKPQDMAELVLGHFGLDRYFDGICGADGEHARQKKDEVINYLLETFNVNTAETLMIGDRKYDMEGAKALGIDALGVLYGYGDREELEAAGADYIMETAGDVLKLLTE